MKKPELSIIILTHNAPKFVKKTIDSLQITENLDRVELIAVDNASDRPTKKILNKAFNTGKINKLLFLDENTLFAKGNNTGEKLCAKTSKLVLLLNSDIEIRSPEWLSKMIHIHKKGITSLGFVKGNPYDRADGYCFMIDKELYEKYHGLDEKYEWFWSITRLQAEVLRDNYDVTAVKNHENLLHHFGGASGGDWQGANGMDVDMKQVIKWFDNKSIKTIQEL